MRYVRFLTMALTLWALAPSQTTLAQGDTALVVCGNAPLLPTYCYVSSDAQHWNYESSGTGTLRLTFLQGTIESASFDNLRIYDGSNATGALLYQHVGGAVNLGPVGSGAYTGSTIYDAVEVYSTTGNFYMEMSSDGSVECDGGLYDYDEWQWEVVCLDCTIPVAAYTVVNDCANSQYFIDVAISDLGTATELGLIATGLTDTLFVSSVGTATVGPFPTGSEVSVTVVSLPNTLCNVSSSTIVNPLCPSFVPCPGAGLQETYCYTANDMHTWAYELQGGPGNLRLTFDRGTIENAILDRIYIFDGPDASAPILWSNAAQYPYAGGNPTGFVQQLTGDLGPLGSAVLSTSTNYFEVDVAATGQNLYMIMESDGSVQCNTTTYDAWEWRVYCVDCANPEATLNVVPDCFHMGYNVEVVVTDAGGNSDLSITNLNTGDTLTNVGVGVHTFGPFPVDSLSVIRVFNQEYPQCRTTSQAVTYAADSCVIISCGVDTYEYCYGNNEDRWYNYKSAINGPITIGFSQGQLLAGDLITIYNGLNGSANTIFQGNNNGSSFAGFEVNSQNVDYALTLRIRSNDTGSCEDSGVAVPLQWAIGCGAIGMDEFTNGSFSVYPNPTEGLLQIELGNKVEGKVQLRITDMSGRIVMEEQLRMNGGTRNAVDMTELQSGQYLVQLTTPDWVKTERVHVAR